MTGRRTLPLGILLFLAAPLMSWAGFAVGLNTGGGGIKYNVSRASSVELRVQGNSDVLATGFRATRAFLPYGQARLLWGVGGGALSFHTENSRGRGVFGELYLGGEYFFTSRFSAQLDAGPSYMALKDKNTGFKNRGMDGVVNIGVNFYWGSP